MDSTAYALRSLERQFEGSHDCEHAKRSGQGSPFMVKLPSLKSNDGHDIILCTVPFKFIQEAENTDLAWPLP